jgi:hypothetical protein
MKDRYRVGSFVQITKALLDLLQKLENIGEERDEIYDTVCRDKMGESIWHGFILPKEKYQLPDDFGLCTESRNEQVKIALQEYIIQANKIAEEKKMNFHDRLNAFQDESVCTATSQKIEFDDFFGWANPEEFNDSGEWLGIKPRKSLIDENSQN